MHGNQWVLKIAVLKYYSVSKRGTTAKSNPKQATDPISLHTKFGDNSSNTFPLNERKPCVTPDIGRRTPDAGHRTSDGEKSKNNISTPQGGGHNNRTTFLLQPNHKICMADERAVRLLPDKCVRIYLKPRFCAARHVRMIVEGTKGDPSKAGVSFKPFQILDIHHTWKSSCLWISVQVFDF